MNEDNYRYTKSSEKTLEILQDIFGSHNQDIIDSAIRVLKEEEQKQKEKQEEK